MISEKYFIVGLALGMIGGMILIKNCKKASSMYEKGQKVVEKAVKSMKNDTKQN